MGRARRARREARVHAPPPEAPTASSLSARATRAGAALVFLAALAAYGLTLAPTVTLVDSGELIVAAHGLGVAHPPGFPLYVLLGHAASLVPAGNVAQRLNALSALCAALAAGLLVLVAGRALTDRSRREPNGNGWAAAAPVLVSGLLLASSRTLWSYATVAEVYALSTLAVVGLLGLALRTRTTGSAAALVILAAACGLATGTHHVTILLAGPAVLALAWEPLRARASPRLLAALALAGTLGAIAIHLYLPWAAARGRFPNWGDARSLERVFWHVSGRQYQAFLSPTLASVGQEAVAFLRALAREFGPAWFPAGLTLAAAGFWSAWKRARALYVALALLVVVDLACSLLYTIAEDKDAYYLPAVVSLCLAAGLGAHEILSRVRRGRTAWALGLLALPLLGGALHAGAADRSRFFVAHDFARDALAAVGPGGLLLTSEWQLYSPLLYFQEIEGWRTDVMAIDVSLLRRSWYVEALRKRHAERWASLRPETDTFLEDLRAWERDPGLYERDAALTRRINDRFQAMVLALCAADAARGRAYATSDVVLRQSPDPALAERLAGAFALTPRGLVFGLGVSSEPAPDLNPRGLFDGTLAIGPDDVASLKVRPVYLSMMVNRGQFLLAQGDRAGAEAAYRRALAWEPTFAPARQGLQRLGAEVGH